MMTALEAAGWVLAGLFRLQLERAERRIRRLEAELRSERARRQLPDWNRTQPVPLVTVVRQSSSGRLPQRLTRRLTGILPRFRLPDEPKE